MRDDQLEQVGGEARNRRCDTPIYVPRVYPNAYQGFCSHRPITGQGSTQNGIRDLRFLLAREATPGCLSSAILQHPLLAFKIPYVNGMGFHVSRRGFPASSSRAFASSHERSGLTVSSSGLKSRRPCGIPKDSCSARHNRKVSARGGFLPIPSTGGVSTARNL